MARLPTSVLIFDYLVTPYRRIRRISELTHTVENAASHYNAEEEVYLEIKLAPLPTCLRSLLAIVT